jgi:hypothetical protein
VLLPRPSSFGAGRFGSGQYCLVFKTLAPCHFVMRKKALRSDCRVQLAVEGWLSSLSGMRHGDTQAAVLQWTQNAQRFLAGRRKVADDSAERLFKLRRGDSTSLHRL